MCYNSDSDHRLKFEDLEQGTSVVVRLLVNRQRRYVIVREYCGVVQTTKYDDGMVLYLKTISGRYRRPLSEPEAREIEIPLYMYDDGMIYVYGDPSKVYGYVLPAAKFARPDVQPVSTYVDRLWPIGQLEV